MGHDRRIGSKFLHAGPGYGGSCFPKDTSSAAHFARSVGQPFEIVEASIRVNERQRQRMVDKVAAVFDGNLAGRTLAMLGLSFKPETDDIREAPAIDIARGLQQLGATIRAFDPQAMPAARVALPDLVLCEDAYEACEGADALLIVTEWNQFRMLDLERIKERLNEPILFDLRNIYQPSTLRSAGFRYESVGR
jgi:UDPglucose 6-dehydrogenase